METPEEKKVISEPGSEFHKKKGKKNWIVPALIAAVVLILLAVLVVIYYNNTHKDKEEPVEQVEPGKTDPGQQKPIQPIQPIVQIDLPPSNGEFNWPDVDQVMLTKALTTSPNLNGESVLLVYIIKGHPSGQDMVWIQTDQAGKIRNIMCQRKYTKL